MSTGAFLLIIRCHRRASNVDSVRVGCNLDCIVHCTFSEEAQSGELSNIKHNFSTRRLLSSELLEKKS